MIRRKFASNVSAFTLEGDAGPTAPGTGSIRWSVSDAQSRWLPLQVHGMRVIEIGTGTGLSAESMAQTALSVSTFDVDDEVKRLVWPNMPDNVFLFDRRESPLSEAAYGGEQFDACFVDGLHNLKGVNADIDELIPLMKPSAIWLFHDMQMFGVNKAVKARFKVIEIQKDGGPTTTAVAKLI